MSKKQELIDLIGIYLKDYTWKIDEELKSRIYDNELWIIIQNKINGREDNYKICMNTYDTWEKNKKRIELTITQYIRKCVICNEIKKLTFCNKCLNQYCYLCDANIIIKNEGATVCPFCRNGGTEDDPKYLENDDVDDIDRILMIKLCNGIKKIRYLGALIMVESKK